jgi:hypothetical protein
MICRASRLSAPLRRAILSEAVNVLFDGIKSVITSIEAAE